MAGKRDKPEEIVLKLRQRLTLPWSVPLAVAGADVQA